MADGSTMAATATAPKNDKSFIFQVRLDRPMGFSPAARGLAKRRIHDGEIDHTQSTHAGTPERTKGTSKARGADSAPLRSGEARERERGSAWLCRQSCAEYSLQPYPLRAEPCGSHVWLKPISRSG